MKADSLYMVKVFSSGGDVQYLLPYFQREYAWEKSEWQTLLKDIFGVYEIYDDDHPPEHFMGSLVVINDGTRAGTVPVFRLVDGQQRLITISLLLCALARSLDEGYETLRRKIHRMLVNAEEEGQLYYKLLPTLKYGDQASYCAIIDHKDPPAGAASRIPHAYKYLITQLDNRFKSDGLDPQRLFNVLMTSLQFVFISLNHNERPYEIFESLNYKGKSLTQADLVRNYIAMKLPLQYQERVFTELWSPIEETLLEKRTVGRSRLGELTAFLRHYFAYLYGVLPNQDHVYSRFRDRGEGMTVDEFEQELVKLKRFAGYYDRLLRPHHEPNEQVRQQLERLNILESATAYPFLLFAYDKWQNGSFSLSQCADGLRVLETYMVRRFLNRDSTNYLNKMFPALSKDIDVTDFAASLRQELGSRNEPTDARLRQAAEMINIYKRDRYTRQKLALVLDSINRHLSQGTGAYTVLSNDPTIEHIMPQKLSEVWIRHLGINWQQDFELLHTLGNLTLITQDWNSSLSNATYDAKRTRLSEHGLLLNRVYFSELAPEHWNSQGICARAQWLMSKATEIWPQLGETSAGWEERPKAVVFLDDVYPVNSWRDVLRQTAELASQWSSSRFQEQVVEELPKYFSRQYANSTSHQLGNGWYVQVGLTADTIKEVCSGIVEAIDIPEEEYDILLW